MNFESYVKAGYSLLWVQTTEETRAIQELSSQVPGYNCFKWDLVTGINTCSNATVDGDIQDPISFFEYVKGFRENSIIFAMDFHKFFEDITVIRQCKSILPDLRAKGKHIVFVSHSLDIPPEMEKDITVFDFEMPSLEALISTATSLRDDNELNFEIDPRIIAAAKGLTQVEAENAFARSIIETGEYSNDILDQERLQTIKKSGLMEIWNPEPLEALKGLKKLKKYVFNRERGFYDDGLPTPKGIFLTGVPGCGKSLSAKVIASILKVPLIRLDIGTLKGSLVGQSEANFKKATGMIDAVGTCVVWMDEVEKALAGVQSSGKTDGGTGSNMFAQLLTWMQESKEKHYIVATCNDIEILLEISQGAFISRFDDVFFVDLPNKEEVKSIFEYMCEKYGFDGSNTDHTRLVGFSGREIEKIVKSSLYDGFEDAISQVKPISQQNKVTIDKARRWAQGNAILASLPEEKESTGRKIG